ncbi:hypothetical protein H5410_026114 [Solanum commersonii]|uniref:Uncharacterized protein n=1 Tax=Solanum commersonii TaxID=4109 RepID=A0A9J5Z0J1_SOLCO|nr:hypothetical protein H5410_026114 [Solanum commersonii]
MPSIIFLFFYSSKGKLAGGWYLRTLITAQKCFAVGFSKLNIHHYQSKLDSFGNLSSSIELFIFVREDLIFHLDLLTIRGN